jgi:predicted DsbA family dithiol-disulfide isomerase
MLTSVFHLIKEVIMKVEIWSDVMCPFCYIGKRRFEEALSRFPNKEKISVVWKSFQLNPAMKTEPNKSINEYLAEIKGISLEQAREMNRQVSDMAMTAGLKYDLDKAIVANSFDAHRIIQFAKKAEKGDVMEELLFKAYFTEGKNIADHGVLMQLATVAGLDMGETGSVLGGNQYADLVDQDVYEARQIGIRGVPYFVFNDRYAVSGAQASDTFYGALNKSWDEFITENVTGSH